MLKIDSHYIKKVQSAKSLKELYPLVQNAIELEHATIPPYLTAMFSIKPGKARDVWNIIHSVVIEEMLHMTIASNIMNAIGGSPAIDNPAFVPNYPGGLPMGIGDGLIVNLEKLTKDVVKNTFMQIEEPIDPITIPVKAAQKSMLLTVNAPEPEFDTIGAFYEYLDKKIQELAPTKLPGNPKKQVTSPFFSSDVLFPILTKSDISRAINIIVEQGEGTSTSPIDLEGEVAHYYRFEEIYVGKALKADKTAPNGYSFSGAPIVFSTNDVFPIYPNTKAAMLAEGSEERRRVDDFNQTYHSLLKGLHRTYNGEPNHLNQTIGLMFDIKLLAEKLCGTPFPGKPGFNVGPTFEYTV